MKFRIHFEHSDGTEDSFDIEGKTLDEIRVKAGSELYIRNGKNPWSEELNKTA